MDFLEESDAVLFQVDFDKRKGKYKATKCWKLNTTTSDPSDHATWVGDAAYAKKMDKEGVFEWLRALDQSDGLKQFLITAVHRLGGSVINLTCA